MKTPIYTHENIAQWPEAEWERRALQIEEARHVIPEKAWNKGKRLYLDNIRRAQELEDGSKDGSRFRQIAVQVHDHIMLLAAILRCKATTLGTMSPTD